MHDGDLNTAKLLNISWFWICHRLYKYVWFPNMSWFIIEVSAGASYINFWNWTFPFNLATILYFRSLQLWTSRFFLEFCFLELFVMLLHLGIYKYFSSQVLSNIYDGVRYWELCSSNTNEWLKIRIAEE